MFLLSHGDYGKKKKNYKTFGSVMGQDKTIRKNLDSQEFLQLRQATEKIAGTITKRLKGHLDVLRPLFMPRKLLGSYVKSANMEEVAGSDKAFAEFQERYAALCEQPFGLPKKLQPPLPPIANQLEVTPFHYSLYCEGSKDKAVRVTSPTKWIVSYRSECPLSRLEAMLSGAESRQADDMKCALIGHLAFVLLVEHFPGLQQLLEDLRYEVEFRQLSDLGRLPVVMVKAPLTTFLPPDDFILQITQLSGIAAFQEIVDLEALQNVADPLKESLIALL